MEVLLLLWKIVLVVVELIGGTVAFFAPLFIIGRWILAPIDRAAKSRKAPVRFSVSDFLCLFLAIQIPLSAVYRFIDYADVRPFWIFFAITWVVGPLVWYCCARTLSKAGVMRGSHRFVFMGLVMPLVYYGFLPFTFLTFANFFTLIGVKGASEDVQFTWMLWPWLLLAILFWLSGVFTHYMLKHIPNFEPSATFGNGPPADASPFDS